MKSDLLNVTHTLYSYVHDHYEHKHYTLPEKHQARSQGGFDRTPLLDQSLHTISIVYHGGIAQSTRTSKGKASKSLELP